MKIIFFLVAMAMSSCGTDEVKVIEVPGDPVPVPPGNGNGSSGGQTSFSQARQVMATYCEGCHANSPWLKDDSGLRASSVKARTKNNSMPPQNAPRRMGQAARAKLLSFF